jgi:hypothetical protein
MDGAHSPRGLGQAPRGVGCWRAPMCERGPTLVRTGHIAHASRQTGHIAHTSRQTAHIAPMFGRTFAVRPPRRRLCAGPRRRAGTQSPAEFPTAHTKPLSFPEREWEPPLARCNCARRSVRGSDVVAHHALDSGNGRGFVCGIGKRRWLCVTAALADRPLAALSRNVRFRKRAPRPCRTRGSERRDAPSSGRARRRRAPRATWPGSPERTSPTTRSVLSSAKPQRQSAEHG